MAPLETLQLDGPALEGVLQVFNSYVNLLIHALPGAVENEEESHTVVVSLAETEAQQMALLANASLLADELLPRAAMKLLPFQQGQANRSMPEMTPKRQSRVPDPGREWKRRLQRSVEQLRDSFCRLHALDLIFTEDGDTRLNAQMYTSMDGNVEPEWFPSPILQELFAKLTTMANIATDMFVGRERFATILLMRLTETVILWLSDDQNFWADIEEGPRPLGPLGLQQVINVYHNPFLAHHINTAFCLIYMHSVLFGYGVCASFCITRPIPVAASASSYKKHHCSSY